MRFRSITTLCLFGAAVIVALKYPLVGLGICCCCLIVYLKPDPPGADKQISLLGSQARELLHNPLPDPVIDTCMVSPPADSLSAEGQLWEKQNMLMHSKPVTHPIPWIYKLMIEGLVSQQFLRNHCFLKKDRLHIASQVSIAYHESTIQLTQIPHISQ